MSNYQILLQKLESEESLHYLQLEYPSIISTFADTQLSFKQMISILWAAERDTLKLTQEIDNLQRKIQELFEQNQQNRENKSIRQYDESQEILYDIEQQLSNLVSNMSQNSLINLQLTHSNQNLNYQQSIQIIEQYINSKCLNKQCSSIMNQQLYSEIEKQRQKNFELQLENMKMMSNLNPRDTHLQQKLYSRQRVKQRLCYSLKLLRQFKQELIDVSKFAQNQYKIFFHQDSLVDKLKIYDNFIPTYNKILKNIKQFNYHNLNKIVQQSLNASNDLNAKDIFITCYKLQDRLLNQLLRTKKHIVLFSQDSYNTQVNNFSQSLIFSQQNVKDNIEKSVKLCNMVCEIFKDKDLLEQQARKQLEDIIHQLNEQNINLKLVILTNTLEKQVKKNSIQTWESLKSIQYQ